MTEFFDPKQNNPPGKEEPAPLSERSKRIKDIMSKLYSQDIPIDERKEINEKIRVFVAHLRTKYIDWSKHRLAHIISFSTVDPSLEITEDDFPGGDSIETFINNLASKYGK